MKDGVVGVIAKYVMWISAIITALTGMFSLVLWMSYPHIESAILDIVESHKGRSTKEMLGEEMNIHKDDVCEQIGVMYSDYLKLKDGTSEMESPLWLSVGYYVLKDDREDVKFLHWDGKTYDAWEDERGWYFVKEGYKYYE